MKIAGVIAEYHPFHSGHAWQLRQLRAAGFDAVVCVMSAGAVQRGELELMPARVRAGAALAGGADLVVALEAPYACKSAEGFALAGVSLLEALGCVDALCFGTEGADADALDAVAAAMEGEAFAAALRRHLDAGLPLAAARAAAAEACAPGAKALLRRPNQILGVDYCRALRRLGSAMRPLALARVGAQHDEGAPAAAGAAYASASHLRALWKAHGPRALAPYVPAECLALYEEAWENGQYLDARAFSAAALSRLRAMQKEDFAAVRGAGEGLANRLWAASRKAGSWGELIENMKTKRYPTARLRRLALDAVLGYTDGLPALPPYLRVLGAGEKGRAVLREASPRLPLGAGLAQLAKTGEGAALAARAHAAAADLAALCRRAPAPCGEAYTGKFLRV